MTLGELFSLSGDSEKVFLSEKELDRFLPTCCAMTNGAGGWIIFGAVLDEAGIPSVEGVLDADSLEKQLTALLQSKENKPKGGSPLVSYFRTISSTGRNNPNGKSVLAARVKPVTWRLRPVCVGKSKHSYRRIEGENVISSQEIRCRMALDALETSRDDVSVPGLAISDLDGKSVVSFRNKLIGRFPKWEALSMENFLKRALVLDEHGGVTRAGELLLNNSTKARLSLQDARKTQENQVLYNLWSACELLTQLSDTLTAPCAKALRECFINAMLHAEHDDGVIDVALADGSAFFSNPGLPRSLEQGESEARNYRLMRIFVMAGLAQGTGQGLGIIREYDANFRLFYDMLRLATVSELPLSIKSEKTESRVPEKIVFLSPSNPWGLPIVHENPRQPAPDPAPVSHEQESHKIDETNAIDTEVNISNEVNTDSEADEALRVDKCLLGDIE